MLLVFRNCWPITFRKSGTIRAPHTTVYSVISRTDQYASFIPWCDSATIVDRISPTHNRTQLAISFKNFRRLKYVSDVRLRPPEEQYSRVHSICTEPPLKQLDSLWEIRAAGNSLSQVDYTLAFEFESPLYQLASSLVINYLGEQMWHIFDTESIRRNQAQKKAQPIKIESHRPCHPQGSIQNLKTFLEKHRDIQVLFARDRRLEKHIRQLDQLLRGSQDYERKMLFQVRNWLAHR